LVDYCDIKFGGCREKYGIPCNRTFRIGLAGFRRALETEGLKGKVERANCSLWTAKKYTDVGGNYWGKNLL
jgi:hypothetical protein